MALMEYCLVNIVLGDSDAPKPPPPEPGKVFFLKPSIFLKVILGLIQFRAILGKRSVFEQSSPIESEAEEESGLGSTEADESFEHRQIFPIFLSVLVRRFERHLLDYFLQIYLIA